MNEWRRDFVLALAGASALLALDFFLPHACADKTPSGEGAAPPSAMETAEEATIR